MIKGIIIFVIGVLIASIAQVLLKFSADKNHANFMLEYLNWRVIGAYSILFISALLTIWAYKTLDLRFTPMLESLGYVFVPLLSWLFIGEKINRKKMLGIVLIIVGIIVFGIWL